MASEPVYRLSVLGDPEIERSAETRSEYFAGELGEEPSSLQGEGAP